MRDIQIIVDDMSDKVLRTMMSIFVKSIKGIVTWVTPPGFEDVLEIKEGVWGGGRFECFGEDRATSEKRSVVDNGGATRGSEYLEEVRRSGKVGGVGVNRCGSRAVNMCGATRGVQLYV